MPAQTSSKPALPSAASRAGSRRCRSRMDPRVRCCERHFCAAAPSSGPNPTVEPYRVLRPTPVRQIIRDGKIIAAASARA